MGIVAVAGFALLGVFVCGLSMSLQAHFSGWHRLARDYASGAPFCGKTWSLRAATFRAITSYWPTLIIGANADALYLAQRWPLSMTHPRLLIPWHDVAFENRRWFEIGGRSLLVGRDHSIRITMSRAIVADMIVHSRK